MPTGYTAFIEDGTITTAKDFIMLCARAFGVCINMRDEPLSKPIPEEFKLDTYHVKEIEKAKTKLEQIEAMTNEEIQKQCDEEYNKRIAERIGIKEYRKRMREKYEKVLNGIKKWNPPTQDHEGLKKFAIEQIEMCLPDYNGNTYFDGIENVEKETVDGWRKRNIESCNDDIKYHKNKWNIEITKWKERNKWLRDLRESIKNLE